MWCSRRDGHTWVTWTTLKTAAWGILSNDIFAKGKGRQTQPRFKGELVQCVGLAKMVSGMD